ncbi:thymidylate synthase [bacterium]|jgi:thymidylate synthase|nr:thymidylate synthase [bacterium]MBT6293442.1 thymidylate synthase [bacterium]
MKEYLSLVKEVLDNGETRSDRTGTGTISVFGTQRKYDLREGFPLVTTKKTLFKAIVHELLWFLKGATNINDGLTQHTPIWDAWADENGDLGPIYGHQWINWPQYSIDENGKAAKSTINQIQKAIDTIKNNPDSRRIIVSAWNVSDIEKMALPPCHTMFQFYVVNGRLDLQLYQRSADIALGVPFNIASYALLLIMVAQECGLEPGIFVHTIGDAHIYSNHVEGLKKQLQREPLERPNVVIAKKPIFELTFEDFELNDYNHHKFIKFPIAV